MPNVYYPYTCRDDKSCRGISASDDENVRVKQIGKECMLCCLFVCYLASASIFIMWDCHVACCNVYHKLKNVFQARQATRRAQSASQPASQRSPSLSTSTSIEVSPSRSSCRHLLEDLSELESPERRVLLHQLRCMRPTCFLLAWCWAPRPVASVKTINCGKWKELRIERKIEIHRKRWIKWWRKRSHETKEETRPYKNETPNRLYHWFIGTISPLFSITFRIRVSRSSLGCLLLFDIGNRHVGGPRSMNLTRESSSLVAIPFSQPYSPSF